VLYAVYYFLGLKVDMPYFYIMYGKTLFCSAVKHE